MRHCPGHLYLLEGCPVPEEAASPANMRPVKRASPKTAVCLSEALHDLASLAHALQNSSLHHPQCTTRLAGLQEYEAGRHLADARAGDAAVSVRAPWPAQRPPPACGDCQERCAVRVSYQTLNAMLFMAFSCDVGRAEDSQGSYLTESPLLHCTSPRSLFMTSRCNYIHTALLSVLYARCHVFTISRAT